MPNVMSISLLLAVICLMPGRPAAAVTTASLEDLPLAGDTITPPDGFRIDEEDGAFILVNTNPSKKEEGR